MSRIVINAHQVLASEKFDQCRSQPFHNMLGTRIVVRSRSSKYLFELMTRYVSLRFRPNENNIAKLDAATRNQHKFGDQMLAVVNAFAMLFPNPDQPVRYGNARTDFFGNNYTVEVREDRKLLGLIPMLSSRFPHASSTPTSNLPELPVNPRPSSTPSVFISGEILKWYALWTRSRHEKVVRDQLIKKGIVTFLPTIPKWSRWKNRRKRIEWPLFPGYCFAQFPGDQQLPVLTCMGVVAVVSFNGKPAPVSDDEVNNLRRVVETELAYDPCPLTKEGMKVEIVNGPLKGIVGQLVDKDAKHAMVVLSVELINQAVRVEVEASDIRAKH